MDSERKPSGATEKEDVEYWLFDEQGQLLRKVECKMRKW